MDKKQKIRREGGKSINMTGKETLLIKMVDHGDQTELSNIGTGKIREVGIQE